ncbi:MAG TPA: Crp/Fnr family transcriptional regulator [Candidatus Krumholzibacteria bacterium]|jgi:CRP/FNR family transcriptional regulator
MDANRPWYFRRINLFRFLRPEQMESLRRQAEHRVYQRKQLVYKAQDDGDALYLVEEGQVKLSRFDERGREIILAILEAGELFGEECLGGRGSRLAYAEALCEARVAKFSRSEFDKLMHENADLSLAVARQISQHLLAAHARLESLAFSNVPARLAETLLRLGEEHGRALPDGEVRIDLNLTHQEIASLIASTRETTTTLLGKLRRQGLIRTEARRIILRDVGRLSRQAAQG